MTGGEFHFLRPWVLALLPLVPLLAWWYGRRHLGAGRWQQWVDPALVPFVLTGHEKGGARRAMNWLFAAVVGLLLVALAGPAWERLPQPVYRDDQALVIALDLSRSMNAQDVLPTRLERARLKVRDMLEKRVEGETALVAFAGDAFTVSPLTDDAATIGALLGALSTDIMPRQGSNLTPALAQAMRLLDQAGADTGHVLLVTDGVADRESAVRAANELASRNVQVSVLALGTPEGEVVRTSSGELVKDRSGQIVVASLDSSALSQVSAAGDGRYVTLSADDSDVDALLSTGEAFLADGALDDDRQTDLWREEGPLLVLICLPFVALMFRRGWIACVAFLMLTPPPPAYAGVWEDLWSRRDQQGARLYQEKAYPDAADRFADREWEAAAAYRAGDYERSIEALDGLDHADAHYNRGNALAMAQRFPEARAAYMAALERDPKHEDARFNLDLLNLQQDQEQNDPNDQSQQNPSSEDGSGQSQSQRSPDAQSSSQQGQGESGGSQQDGSSDEQNPGDDPAQRSGEESQQGEDEQGQQDMQAREGEQQDGEQGRSQGLSEAEQERDLAAEQWLRQVPDDPGGLLRRKFQRQYRQRYREQPPEVQEW